VARIQVAKKPNHKSDFVAANRGLLLQPIRPFPLFPSVPYYGIDHPQCGTGCVVCSMRNEGRAAADAILRFRVPRALREAAEAAAALEAQTLCVGLCYATCARTPAVQTAIRRGIRRGVVTDGRGAGGRGR
jgi:hypothetical protein